MNAARAEHGMWAVVPVKHLAGAKQRLAGVLSPAQRRRLVLVMLEDVLAALDGVADAGGITGVAVITGDPAVRDLAASLGARVLAREHDAGHTEAVAYAAGVLRREGCAGMITIPGDVPLASTDEIARLLCAHAPAPAVSLAPARDRLGSNGVVCSPPDVLPLRFGEDSFHPHLESARRLGITPAVVPLAGLGLDIDLPADLRDFAAHPSDTHTWRWLSACGLADVLQTAPEGKAEVL